MNCPPLFNWLRWALATWLALAGVWFAGRQIFLERPVFWLAMWTLPGLAVYCAERTMKESLSRSILLRGFWWAGNWVAIFPIIVWGGDAWFKFRGSLDGSNFAIAALLASWGFLIFVASIRLRNTNLKGIPVFWLCDIGRGLLYLIMLGVLWLSLLHLKAIHLEKRALQKWAEIGRPMEAFEKAYCRSEENASLLALEQDLKPLGVSSLYYPPSGKPQPSLPTEFYKLKDDIKRICKNGADIIPQSEPSAYLKAHTAKLRTIYRNILTREIPRWYFDIEKGWTVRQPHISAVNGVCGLFLADAQKCIEARDFAGAKEAMAATEKLLESLRSSPFHQAHFSEIEALTRLVEVRLPAESDGWEKLPAEIDQEREMHRKGLQSDTVKMRRYFRLPNTGVPEGLAMFLTGSSRVWLARATNAITENVALTTELKYLNTPDLGRNEIKETYRDLQDDLSSWLHLQKQLLLREQAEVLRQTRARLYANLPVRPDEFSSAVIPGAHWKVIADPVALTAALILTPAPAWTEEDKRIKSRFYLLPLDGSKSWQFAPRPGDASQQRPLF